MVDVTATETGTKKVTVTLTDGRYVIHNKSDYRLILNSTVNPFPEPSLWQVTPNIVDSEQIVPFIIEGSGFLSFVGVVFAVSPNLTFGPFPPGTLTVIDDTHIEVIQGLSAYLASINVPPFSFYFKFVPTVGPEIDTDTVLVNPAIPTFGITGISPLSVDQGSDPPVTITGFGFITIGVNQINIQVGQTSGLAPYLLWHVEDDNTLIIDSGFVQLADFTANADGQTAPYEAFVVVDPMVGSPAYSPGVTVNPIAPPIDPLSDADYFAYTGAPGEISVEVTQGPVHFLAALDAGENYGPVQIPFNGGGEESYSFAVWFRHAGALPTDAAGFFAKIIDIMWEAKLYNGSLEAIQWQAPSILESEETPPGIWPPYASDPNWHMVVIVRDYDGTIIGPLPSVYIYMDGVQVVSVPVSGPMGLPFGPQTFQVGGPSTGFDFTQATGAVWKRALTDPEIQLMYAATVFPP